MEALPFPSFFVIPLFCLFLSLSYRTRRNVIQKRGSAKQAKPLAVRFACCGKDPFYTGLKPLPMISLEFSIMIKAVGSCWRMKLRRRMA